MNHFRMRKFDFSYSLGYPLLGLLLGFPDTIDQQQTLLTRSLCYFQCFTAKEKGRQGNGQRGVSETQVWLWSSFLYGLCF